MRLLVRAGIVVAAAGGILVAAALTSSADVVEPSSAYQPASTSLLATGSPEAMGNLPAEKMGGPQTTAPEEAAALAEARESAPATPAPEHEVKPAPAHITRTEPVHNESGLAAVVRPLRVGLEEIGSYLGQAVSACQVAAGSGAGVPVLALAVLSVAATLERRRVLGTRFTADEDVPELLYATEVIAQG